MAIVQWSEDNLTATVAQYLADQLLAVGYIVYWLPTDALQTNAGWYYGWTANFVTYQADPAVQTILAAAKGMVTLKDATTAKVLYPTRHTVDGSVSAEDELQVPHLSVQVDGERPGRFTGLGDRQRERFRTLVIYGCVRDVSEQSLIRDSLVRWFDDATFLPVKDYDAGTLTVFGDVELEMPMAEFYINGLAPEASRFEVILNARLRYEA